MIQNKLDKIKFMIKNNKIKTYDRSSKCQRYSLVIPTGDRMNDLPRSSLTEYPAHHLSGLAFLSNIFDKFIHLICFNLIILNHKFNFV
jgi:hypothetical protein